MDDLDVFPLFYSSPLALYIREIRGCEPRPIMKFNKISTLCASY